jgi:hypothetical protein
MKYGKYMRIKRNQNHRFEHSNIKSKIMDQEMEKLIWEFIDGHCGEDERAAITRHLAEDPVWADKYTELMQIHEMLQKEELEMPSLRFTKNIMEEIAQYHVAPATKNYINKNVIRGVAAFFLVMIAGLFIYLVGQIHWSNNATSNLIPDYNLEASKLNWSKLINNTYVNIFIGINAILGLIFIDKYMRGRKKVTYTGGWTKGDSA